MRLCGEPGVVADLFIAAQSQAHHRPHRWIGDIGPALVRVKPRLSSPSSCRCQVVSTVGNHKGRSGWGESEQPDPTSASANNDEVAARRTSRSYGRHHGAVSDVSRWWINGQLVDPATAALPIADHGLTVGDGCFETTKVVDGNAFALTRHLDRLRRSLAGLRIELPLSDDDLRAAVNEVLATGTDTGIVRITVTAGPGPLSSGRHEGVPTVIVATAPARGWAVTAEVITVEWPRNERGVLAGVKSTSYAENVVALAEAKLRGASEAIFPNIVGNLCEGTGTNIFVELEGRLVTPPLTSGCLAGITRELVLECTAAEEADLPIEHLLTTTEAFLTSSTRDVMPISRIDDRILEVGALTDDAMARFDLLAASSSDP